MLIEPEINAVKDLIRANLRGWGVTSDLNNDLNGRNNGSK